MMVRALRNNYANAWGQGPGAFSLFGRPVVLVVDDDPDFLFITKEILELNGFGALVARSGAEGVEAFHSLHMELDLVFVDLSAPLDVGREVVGAIRRISPSVPVLLSSNQGEGDAGNNHDPHGPTAYIRKPYSFNRLMGRIKQIVGESPPL